MIRKTLERFGHLGIRARIVALTVAAAVCVVVQAHVALGTLEAATMKERRAKLRATVETVHGVLARYASLAERGDLSREDARRQALECVRGLRYEGEEYFWINDLGPRMVMHPTKPALDGKDLSNHADPTGKKLFVEFVSTVREHPKDGGFVDYRWPKPGMNEPVRKLSYVKLFEPWGWVVGSGVYLDDVDRAMAAEARRAYTVTGTIALVFALLAGLVARSTGRTLAGLRAEAAKLGRAVTDGDLRVRADPRAVSYEFQVVVRAMNETLDAFTHPFSRAADCVSRIARGEVPARFTTSCKGDFKKLDDDINACIDAVNLLVCDGRLLTQAAREGKLGVRADATAHAGDFRAIIEGMNATLDAATAPIREATAVLEKLAERDLTARATGAYEGDHARIKDSLNTTACALSQSLSQVSTSVDQVSSAARQIATASGAVAEGASEQARSIEEASASLTSMTTLTKEAATSAEEANDIARGAMGAAGEGTAAMDRMAAAMDRIRASAQGTSEIIKVINEIAFQTNLLALNAAVEAARAGDAGRGFAVVADEVRSLALRSKEAAQKTEDLIRQSVREAVEGAATSKRVSETLAQIEGAVTKASAIVSHIADSAKRQAKGLDELSARVGEIDSVTQQNAASSEQSSAAAMELAEQASALASIVGAFRLERIERDASPASLPRAGRRARQPLTDAGPMASA